MKRQSITYVMALVVTAALAQTKSSPKPSPNAAASLPVTLKLIQDKVNEQGEIRYTMMSESTVDGHTVEDRYTVETSHALADPTSCAMQVDAKMTMNGKTQRQGRATVEFRGTTGLAIKSQTNAIDEQSVRAGVTGWKGKITPESYMIQTFHSGSLAGILFFRERATAEDVGKASAVSLSSVEERRSPSKEFAGRRNCPASMARVNW
jgi:hypothetical protein